MPVVYFTLISYLYFEQSNRPQQTYNMTTGRAACWKELDKPVFRLCQTVPGIEVGNYIEDCAKDAVVIDNGLFSTF